MELLIWNRGMLVEGNWESVFEYYTVSLAFRMLHSAHSQARPGLGAGGSSLCPFNGQGLTLQGLGSILGSSSLGLSVLFLLLYCIWGKKVHSWCLFSTWHVCWAAVRAPVSSSCAGAICDVCVFMCPLWTPLRPAAWFIYNLEYNHFGMGV